MALGGFLNMRLELRFFASTREALGRSGFAVEFAHAPASVADLVELIDPERQYEALRDARLRVAVNGRILEADAPLIVQHGDEVAFLPAVTGG